MILRSIRRSKFARAMRTPGERPLGFYYPLWAESDAVYIGAVGPEARVYPEAEALDRVIKSSQVTDGDLVLGSRHENVMVCAYCLEALHVRGSPKLRDVSPAAFTSPRKVRFRFGCYAVDMLLAERVREYQRA